MLWRFVKLEWKSFIRSSAFGMNMALKIILGLAASFYAVMFLILGAGMYYIIKEAGLEPLSSVNRFLIYWVAADLVIRYFLQKAPIMSVRSLLTLPISKKGITRYLMGKSAFSFFNIYPAFFFLPFSIVLIINDYSILGVIAWHLAIVALTLFNNFLNLAVNNKDKIFILVLFILVGLGILQYYQILDITEYAGPVFQAFYELPWTVFIVLGLTYAMYRYNFNYFYNALYLDEAINKVHKLAKVRDYTWLNRFGLMGTFLKNDLRLILRNKRPRSVLWVSALFLLYGLLFFTNSMYNESDFWLIFAAIFVTGGFLFTFGSYVPSWDSAYYPLLMSQNIKYKEYLTSKWWLIVIATFVSMILSVFYLYFGLKFYLAILAGGIYNIGVNGHIVLLSGAYVKTPIDLSSGKKPFGDSRAFNLKTVLLTIPKIILPILLFYIFKLLFNDTAGLLAIAVFGILGLAFRNMVFRMIEKIYKKEKYDTLRAYKEG